MMAVMVMARITATFIEFVIGGVQGGDGVVAGRDGIAFVDGHTLRLGKSKAKKKEETRPDKHDYVLCVQLRRRRLPTHFKPNSKICNAHCFYDKICFVPIFSDR